MPQRFPVGTVPTEPQSAAVPTGPYRVLLPRLQESTTKDGGKLKYTAGIGFQIIEGELSGTALLNHAPTFNDMVIGAIDNNGELMDPEDWKKQGGVLLNNMLHAAGVIEQEDVEAMLDEAEGREVIMTVRVEKDTKNDPPYPDKNRIVRFYPVPDAAPKIAPKPVPAAQPRPTLPASRPGQVSARVAASAAPANGPAKPTAAPAKAEAYPCAECEPRNDIPRRAFAKHLALHESFAAWPEDKRPRFIPADANEEWTPA